MWFPKLADSLRSRTPGFHRRRCSSQRRPTSLEPLENRILPAAVFTISDIQVPEGNSGEQQVAVVVSLSSPHGNAVTVDYRSVAGTATEDVDYTAVSGKLTFTKNQSSKTIFVPVLGDRTGEPDERFSIVLSNAKGAKIQDGTGIVTIQDDEPRISITDAWEYEGNSGTTAFKFTISLSDAADSPVTVNYATANGSAVDGSDYTALSGSYTFGVGETSKDIYVDVTGDRSVEFDETFVVNLTSSDALLAKSVGTGTIIDDEPQISIDHAVYYEGSGATTMTFYVYLSVAVDEVVTVDYATFDETAIDGYDYVGTSGTLTFDPFETVQWFEVQVLNPYYYGQYFWVQLSNASANASISPYYGWAVGYWDYYYYWGY